MANLGYDAILGQRMSGGGPGCIVDGPGAISGATPEHKAWQWREDRKEALTYAMRGGMTRAAMQSELHASKLSKAKRAVCSELIEELYSQLENDQLACAVVIANTATIR